MFLKPKHCIFECRPNFGSFCPLPGPLKAIVFSAPKPPPSQFSAYATAWYGTGRDICTNNYFTSYTLANQLLQQNLTLLGTVCRHRRNVPLVLRQKDMYWSKFVFNHGDGICLVAYQAKRNKDPQQ